MNLRALRFQPFRSAWPLVPARRLPLLWAEPLLLLLIAGWLLFAHLGGYPLFDVDEGAFAEATREMVASNDWRFPTLDGAPRYDKPILIYWLQAAAITAFGLSEWTVRLPSALAALLWVLATWHFARSRFGPTAAVTAAAILATALGPWAIGRAATADALLNLLLALTAFDAWRHLESHHRAPLVRAYGWMALGVLTKGPVAILVPAAAVVLYCWSRGEWRRPFPLLAEPLGWLLFAAIALPWYSYALWHQGWGFVEGFFFKHNLRRFADPLEGHAGRWWYYLAVTPLLLAPWSLLLIPLFTGFWRDRTVALRRYLWGWFLFVLLFFSLTQTKLPHYLLYGITPLALLIAVRLQEREGARRWLATVPWLSGLLLIVAALLPLLLDGVARHGNLSPFDTARAAASLTLLTGEWPVAAGGTLLLLIAAWQTLGRRFARFTALCAAVLLLHWAAFRLLPWAGDLLQGPIVEAAQASREIAVVNAGLRAPSFSFYRQAVTLKRPPAVGERFVTRIDRLPEVSHRIIWQARGVVLGERSE